MLLYDGRWLRDRHYLDDYSRFWFRGGGSPRRYSCWLADAIWARAMTTGEVRLAIDLLPDLIKNYQEWEKEHFDAAVGMFKQIDDRDGMEVSIGGSGFRPTLNAYMAADALAISRIAAWAGQPDISSVWAAKARALRERIDAVLWDEQAQFYKTSPDGRNRVEVREEIGFVPWYFGIPGPERAVAWKQRMDPQGFYAPFGPTTAERRSPRFMFANPHDCLWNGPSWPYATTQTLAALAVFLRAQDRDDGPVTRADYLALLRNSARSQYKDGHPWIAEDLDPLTGRWIVDKPRSVYYNHSAYCDLIISGLIGLHGLANDAPDARDVRVRPLVPEGTWDYFCLDGIPYRGHSPGVTTYLPSTSGIKAVGLFDGRKALTLSVPDELLVLEIKLGR